MLKQLSSLSVYLWLFAIAAQLFICLQFLSGRAERYPRFRVYVIWQTVTSVIAFAIVAAGFGRIAYVSVFYVGTVTGSALMLCAAFEVYMVVFGPRMALPKMVPERTMTMVAIAFSASAAMGVIAHSFNRTRWLHDLVVAEQVLTVAGWAIFMILLIYSRSLRISWPKKITQICFGFVLYLSIDILAVFVRTLGNMSSAIIAGQVGQMAYVLSLGWWMVCLWEKEEKFVAITKEQVEQMSSQHAQTMEAMRRAGVQV